MKTVVLNLLNIISVSAVIIIFLFLGMSFHLINLSQAERIAKWQTEYEELVYCFNLARIHEKNIFEDYTNNTISSDELFEKIKPYFNLAGVRMKFIPSYKYKKLNGKPVNKNEEFYFDKFVYAKNGILLSIKPKSGTITDKSQPLFFMLADINGTKSPNRIGEDIFLINIYPDKVKPMGYDVPNTHLKTNCSPIGSGIYCSKYYLYGGSF